MEYKDGDVSSFWQAKSFSFHLQWDASERKRKRESESSEKDRQRVTVWWCKRRIAVFQTLIQRNEWKKYMRKKYVFFVRIAETKVFRCMHSRGQCSTNELHFPFQFWNVLFFLLTCTFLSPLSSSLSLSCLHSIFLVLALFSTFCLSLFYSQKCVFFCELWKL